MSNILFSLELLASVLCLAYLAKLLFMQSSMSSRYLPGVHLPSTHLPGMRYSYGKHIHRAPFEVVGGCKRSLQKQLIAKKFNI